MKTLMVIGIVVYTVAVARLANADQVVNLTLTDFQWKAVTNQVAIYNAQNGTSVTAEQAIRQYGVANLVEKERARVKTVVSTAYENANQATKNNIHSALGISP